MSEGSGDWYMRARGRILGPFTMPQLQSLRDRGQLSQFHEVSQDRRSWISAANVPDLFSMTVGERTEFAQTSGDDRGDYGLVEIAGTGPGRTSNETAQWFFARGTAHQGPYYLADLQRMADIGEIGPSTMIWKSGMPNWVPASQVPEIRFPLTAGPPSEQVLSTGQATARLSSQQSPRTSGLAISSFVLGLLTLFDIAASWAVLIGAAVRNPFRLSDLAAASFVIGFFVVGGIGSVLAITLGAIALSQVSRSGGMLRGKGFAVTGLTLGILTLFYWGTWVFLFVGAAMGHE